MAEFLLELFSEEIPARMQVKAADDMKDLIAKGLADKGLTFTKAESHSTPRRITVVVDGLPEQQPDTVTDKRGPRVDAPEQALQGFLKSISQTNFDKCVKEESPKGTFWFYREDVKGQATQRVLPAVVEEALAKIVWPKSMRWKASTRQWVRPLHGIIALFKGEVVPLNFALGGDEKPVTSGKTTEGHRFLSSGPITVSDFADYKEKLKKGHVLLAREDRKAIISKQAQELANKEGLKVREDEGLLEEIVGLVEWPVPLVGTFEKEYLDVPQEVLISTMRGNQKYMALLDAQGKLSNKFVVIANMITEDGGKQVVAGNEKVLRARLADAKFFWDQDRRQKLESRLPALEQITFHQKLGTVRNKVDRISHLAGFIAEKLSFNVQAAKRAALLSKADLTCGVVFQFPEVQGIMGRYYALHEKESEDVANAIADHYKPVGSKDEIPRKPISICVALADKLDTLVGFFIIGEKPTGSKDPFALRRAALGMIRILTHNPITVDFKALYDEAASVYIRQNQSLKFTDKTFAEVWDFISDRFKHYLKEAPEIKYDHVDAVLSLRDSYDIKSLDERAHSLSAVMREPEGKALKAAYDRADSILKKGNFVRKPIGEFATNHVKQNLLHEIEEQALYKAINEVDAEVTGVPIANAPYCLTKLKEPVDNFFNKVMVNCEDKNLQTNRFELLYSAVHLLNKVADFSKLEG